MGKQNIWKSRYQGTLMLLIFLAIAAILAAITIEPNDVASFLLRPPVVVGLWVAVILLIIAAICWGLSRGVGKIVADENARVMNIEE